MLHTRDLGMIGEDVSCTFLKRHGFEIVARNYQKKWGEIDIIARKGGVTHFFEVKSVTSVHDERSRDVHRPEDNVHGLKGRHIGRMIETYLSESRLGLDAEFYFHVLCVYMDLETRRARVKWVKNVIL